MKICWNSGDVIFNRGNTGDAIFNRIFILLNELKRKLKTSAPGLTPVRKFSRIKAGKHFIK